MVVYLSEDLEYTAGFAPLRLCEAFKETFYIFIRLSEGGEKIHGKFFPFSFSLSRSFSGAKLISRITRLREALN